MENLTLYSKLAALPEELKAEVSDFVDFLKSKCQKSSEKKRPQFGGGKGMFVMKPGFDEPLDDFKEYMY